MNKLQKKIYHNNLKDRYRRDTFGFMLNHKSNIIHISTDSGNELLCRPGIKIDFNDDHWEPIQSTYYDFTRDVNRCERCMSMLNILSSIMDLKILFDPLVTYEKRR